MSKFLIGRPNTQIPDPTDLGGIPIDRMASPDAIIGENAKIRVFPLLKNRVFELFLLEPCSRPIIYMVQFLRSHEVTKSLHIYTLVIRVRSHLCIYTI